MKKLLCALAFVLAINTVSGQFEIASFAGASRSFTTIAADTGNSLKPDNTPLSLRYGLTVGYTHHRLTVEMEYALMGVSTGYTINTDFENSLFAFRGGDSFFEDFSRIGLQAKYNLAKNPNAFNLSPIVGLGFLLSDQDKGVFGSGKRTSGSNGITTFASVDENTLLATEALQLSLGAEFGISLSRRVELYFHLLYSIGTSDVIMSDISYEADTPNIENITIEELSADVLMNKATVINKLSTYHSSFGVRFRLGNTGQQKIIDGKE